MSEYADVKDLPDVVKSALESVGYHRKNVEVKTCVSVQLGDSGSGGGQRSFTTLVDLANGKYTTSYGSWGGVNMFDRSNPVDNDEQQYPLPPNGAAIKGSIGGSHPVFAQIYIPAAMRSKILTAAVEPVPKVELDALYCHGRIKGGAYRRDELRRREVPARVVDDLVARGLLARNRAGATSITTAGRNALGSYYGS